MRNTLYRINILLFKPKTILFNNLASWRNYEDTKISVQCVGYLEPEAKTRSNQVNYIRDLNSQRYPKKLFPYSDHVRRILKPDFPISIFRIKNKLSENF